MPFGNYKTKPLYILIKAFYECDFRLKVKTSSASTRCTSRTSTSTASTTSRKKAILSTIEKTFHD